MYAYVKDRNLLKYIAPLLVVLILAASALAPAQAAGETVLVTAAFYDGYVISGITEIEEGLQIMNVSGAAIDISGWGITDNEGLATFPANTTLNAGQRLWLAYDAVAFSGLFGFSPDFEYGADSDPGVPNMGGSAPVFSNSGDEVVVLDGGGAVVDALVYENGLTGQTGWSGAAVLPFDVFPMNPYEQILFRKLDEASGYPLADTNTAADWGPDKTLGTNLYGPVDEGDLYGKKVMTPGWDMGIYGATTSATDFWVPLKVTESADVKVMVAPDNIYDGYISAINSATTSIYIEGYTFQQREIAEAIAAKATAGVDVRVLLEGGPCCDMVPDQLTLWVAKTISDAGGQVYFMHDDSSSSGGHDRYNFQHAKFTLIDGAAVLTGSENLNCGSMPNDNKTNGTSGNRGTYLQTNAPSVVAHFLEVFNLDLDPANHKDIVPYGWSSDYTWNGDTVPAYCADTDGTFYTVQKASPLALSGTFNWEVVQAPENLLRFSDSLIGMVLRAGAGDVVLVQQAYERTFWGDSTSNPSADPNPRLEAYIEAARRGASVRIVFDAEYDDPASARGNTASVDYVNTIAADESLDLQARLVDCSSCVGPAGSGIHNKMVMVYDPAGATAWIHIGSINGSENSTKFNRELAVQVESLDAYCYLYDIINYDWMYSGGADLGLGCGGPVNNAPTVTINSPADGATFTSGELISFSGTASDVEDGDLTASLAWTSSIDGLIGTGGSFSVVLSDGAHTITADVTDSGGKTGSDVIGITVGGGGQLFVTVTTDKPTYANKETATITVTVTDGTNPVEGAAVEMRITVPKGGVITSTDLTAADGTAVFTHKINANKNGFGTYTVDADASKSGYTSGSGSTSFTVQ